MTTPSEDTSLSAPKSSWAPLAEPLFRTLWIAALISDTGIWTQDMAASWLMTSVTTSALLISLMQGAANLPYFLFAFPAGVLADTFNHRTMLMITALFISAVSLIMAAVASAVSVQPWMLLVYVFAIGVGNAFYDPVWKGVVPQLVKPDLQTAAFGLDGVAVNVARSLGPALAGILISIYSPALALGFNALAFLCLALLLLRWTPTEKPLTKFSRAGFISSIRTGIQFARYSPPVVRILLRSFLFLLPGSVMWALLPIIGRQTMGLAAGSYGVLIGCVGLGAIVAVTFMSRLKHALGVEHALFFGAIGFLLNLFVLAFVQRFSVLCFTMPLAGAGWVLVLANLQASILPATPTWVRGRVIALYSLTFFGSVSVGSIVWGLIAEHFGVTASIFVAIFLMGFNTILGFLLPLPTAGSEVISGLEANGYGAINESIVIPAEGPVVISFEYRVALKNKESFILSILELGKIRRKNGAYQWGVFEDIENSEIQIERFIVSSRTEFQEMNSRTSDADNKVFANVMQWTANQAAPVKRYLRMEEIL